MEDAYASSETHMRLLEETHMRLRRRICGIDQTANVFTRFILHFIPVGKVLSLIMGLLNELLESRSSNIEINGFTEKEITDLIDLVCVS